MSRTTKEMRRAWRVTYAHMPCIADMDDDLDEAERDRDEAYAKGWNDAVLKMNASAARVANLNDQEAKAVIRDRDAWRAKAEAAVAELRGAADVYVLSTHNQNERVKRLAVERDEAVKALEEAQAQFRLDRPELNTLVRLQHIIDSALARIRGSR